MENSIIHNFYYVKPYPVFDLQNSLPEALLLTENRACFYARIHHVNPINHAFHKTINQMVVYLKTLGHYCRK
jgi:hypothetical protein